MTLKKREKYLLLFVVLSVTFLLTYIVFFSTTADKYFYKTYLSYQENKYSNIVAEQGTESAFQKLEAEYQKNPLARHVCHDSTHAIGKATYLKLKNLNKSLAIGNDFCWSGYYHGLLEAYLIKNEISLDPEIMRICSDIGNNSENYILFHSCLHGLGHTIMFLKNNELFEALPICDTLKTEPEKLSCHTGIFMENANTNFKYHSTKYLRENNLLYPCTIVQEKYKQACYKIQSSYILAKSNYNFKKVFEHCEKADAKHQKTCYESIGRDVVDESAGNIKKMWRLCEKGHTLEKIKPCVTGAVQMLSTQFSNAGVSQEFCDTISHSEIKSDCITEIKHWK